MSKGGWLFLAGFIALLTLLIVCSGCATPRSECSSNYKSTQLRNEGKVVLWCVR